MHIIIPASKDSKTENSYTISKVNKTINKVFKDSNRGYTNKSLKISNHSISSIIIALTIILGVFLFIFRFWPTNGIEQTTSSNSDQSTEINRLDNIRANDASSLRGFQQTGQMLNRNLTINTTNFHNDNLYEEDSALLKQRNAERKYEQLMEKTWSEFYPILVVNIDKAHIYSLPDEYALKNAYCILGDKVAVEESLNDWVKIAYSNGSTITKGYMKKEDLAKDSALIEEQFGKATSSVENLRVRLLPDLKAPVIYLTAKGEQNNYLGYKTNYSTYATIQGLEQYEQWYYIKVNDELNGWVHGCCIKVSYEYEGGE